MRDIYKYSSKKSWERYYEEKAKGFPYSGAAALQLNDGCSRRPRNNKFDEPGSCFAPYWCALELLHEGEIKALKTDLGELLEKCKKNYKDALDRERQFKSSPAHYKGFPLNWEFLRPYDESFNSYDCVTWKCELPIKLSDEEVEELREDLWEHFYDPYGDGRDCTGVWFTTSISCYRCTNKTIIIHTKHCDV